MKCDRWPFKVRAKATPARKLTIKLQSTAKKSGAKFEREPIVVAEGEGTGLFGESTSVEGKFIDPATLGATSAESGIAVIVNTRAEGPETTINEQMTTMN